MKLYCIENIETGNLLGISIFSNEGGEFCHDCGARFEFNDYSQVYMVTEYGTADRALSSDPDWYNASLERPQWPDKFNPGGMKNARERPVVCSYRFHEIGNIVFSGQVKLFCNMSIAFQQ